MNVEERISSIVSSIRQRTDFMPKLALILGSGLGDFADRIEVVCEVPYQELDHFPVSTVPGHAGRFIFGYLKGIPMVCMKGRVHYYEGYAMEDVVLPTRVMARLGAKILFLTNAAGGLGDGFQAGDLMMITDQIAMFVPNPLIGPNDDRIGVRFPDMTNLYDPKLCNLIRQCAKAHEVTLREGIYAQLTGPSYESPAEIRALKVLGASAVGMSTAVEAIAARHIGMRICGISCISNLAAGLSGKPLSHDEVQAAADAAAKKFSILVEESIIAFDREKEV